MNKQITWIAFLIFILVLLSLFVIKSTNEDSWVCTESGWTEHGKPSMTKPTIPCGKNEMQLAVQKYLEENIFQISPQKEVLGGKFYITKINWTENNSGLVEYEDGHIALKAIFDYSVIVNKDNATYTVIINNFKITE